MMGTSHAKAVNAPKDNASNTTMMDKSIQDRFLLISEVRTQKGSGLTNNLNWHCWVNLRAVNVLNNNT